MFPLQGPWDVCKKVFSEADHKTMSLYDKSDLFFHDYSIAPLFVQENYPKAVPHIARCVDIPVLENMYLDLTKVNNGKKLSEYKLKYLGILASSY